MGAPRRSGLGLAWRRVRCMCAGLCSAPLTLPPAPAPRPGAQELERFWLVNVYVPNSGEGLKRLDYRVRAAEGAGVFGGEESWLGRWPTG
jgi:hypothetical protein